MTEQQQAFVLHSRPYRENQLLVDLLTEDNGKVAGLIYVGQSKRSIKKGLLQPFLPLYVTLKDLGALKKIATVEAKAKSYPLNKNYLYSGFYLNELLIRLLNDGVPCASLFLQYQNSLTLLAQEHSIAPTLREFELGLLDELGLSFDFEPIYMDEAFCFSYQAEQGFVPIYQKLSESGVVTKGYFLTQHLQVIAEHIGKQNLSNLPSVDYTFKRLMRTVLNQLLGHKPLNSRKLFLPRKC